jgi:hypothetical protein
MRGDEKSIREFTMQLFQLSGCEFVDFVQDQAAWNCFTPNLFENRLRHSQLRSKSRVGGIDRK